jgi:eukaryotic-like serine/threonine-protein kinase
MSQYQPLVSPRTQRVDRRSDRRMLVALALASATLLAGCADKSEAPSTDASTPAESVTPTSTTPPPPPAPPPVTADSARSLLPSLDELKTIMDNPELIAGPDSTGVAVPDPSQQVYEPADCASSFSAGAPPAYEGTGWRGFFGASQAQSPTPSVMLGESVVTFDDAAAAQKALAHYVEQWRRCANKQFTWKMIAQGQQAAFTLGEPVDAGNGVTSLRNVNPDSPVSVTRAIAARNNVLVDVQIMGSDLAEQNVTIAQRILERIPG